MIKLIDEEMWRDDLRILHEFLLLRPQQLSQGRYVAEFEHAFSIYAEATHALFVNSGSSANLLMAYVLVESGKLKNKTVICPAVSWATTVSPWMQFGFDVVLCDSDKNNLGMDCEHLEELCKKHNPSVIMPVHVLGMAASITDIADIANKAGAVLLEDCCESIGARVDGKTVGSFGAMASYSTFVGHQMSTVEGGFVTTNDTEMYIKLRLMRAHGWNRDIGVRPEYYSVDAFQDKYNFYIPGFNLRGQEINAYMGLRRLDRIAVDLQYREMLFQEYQARVKNKYWKPCHKGFVPAFAYPVIHPDRAKIVSELTENGIDSRPLIAGSMEFQPMYVKMYGFKRECHLAENIHKYGFYVPIHCNMTVDDVELISDIINQYYIEDR